MLAASVDPVRAVTTTATPDPVRGLASAVNALAAEATDRMSDRLLAHDLTAIRRQIDRLEAEFTRRLARFDSNHGALSEGAVSTVSWVRAACGLTVTAAADRVRMARTMGELPAVADSFAAGRMPTCNASLIARLANDVGAAAIRSVEDTLVTAGEQLDAGRMYRVTQFTRYQVDSDGALDRDNRSYQRRWFACDQTLDGIFVLRGELDAEGGAVVKAAVESLCGPPSPEDDRSGSQRRADALVEIASAQLRSGDRQIHGQRPHVTLTVSSDVLRTGEGAAELDGVVIHAETARRVACDSVVTSVRLDQNGKPLSVGRAKRTSPPHIRTAVVLRDVGCRAPGCDRPAAWTDCHHIREWTEGGETSVDNLLLLCRTHHRMVHEGRWKISLDPLTNAVQVVRPRDGPIQQRRLQGSVRGTLPLHLEQPRSSTAHSWSTHRLIAPGRQVRVAGARPICSPSMSKSSGRSSRGSTRTVTARRTRTSG